MDGSMIDDINPGDSIPPKWKRWFREDKEHSSKWRKDAKDEYEFVAGRQWSSEDKATLKEEMRPAITFDRTSVIIDAVSGQEIQNRQEVRYIPREEGDAQVNELYSEAARWYDDQSEAEDEDSEAFIDSLICGMGWTETKLDFDTDPEGAPVTTKEDPLCMYWDAGSRKSNLRDARRLWKVIELSHEEAKEQFPDYTREEIDAGKWVDTGNSNQAHENDPEEYYEDDESTGDLNERKTVKVLHLQYWHWEHFYKVADPMTGQVTEMDADRFTELEKNLSAFGIQLKSAKLRRRKFMQAFIGQKVLEHKPNACTEHFTWNCITGKYDRNRAYWYGMIRKMRDPQTWANKWMSQVLHIMNSNAKGGVMYESGSFVDQRAAEADWAKPHAMIEATEGALQNQRIQPKQASQFPAGYQMLTEFAISAIRDVTGVNMELLGMREANQAGVLEYQRRQAGLTVLSVLFNSLRRYRRARGRVLLYYIHENMSDGRLIRITGEMGQKYVPLRKQADAKYDIIIDDAPTSPNQKEIIWQSLMQVLPGIKDMVPPQVLLQLLEYSPVPPSVVEKIKKVVEAPNPQAEMQAKMQAQMALAELQKTQAEIEKTQSETRENEAETALDEAKLGLEQQKIDNDRERLNLDVVRELVPNPAPTNGSAGRY